MGGKHLPSPSRASNPVESRLALEIDLHLHFFQATPPTVRPMELTGGNVSAMELQMPKNPSRYPTLTSILPCCVALGFAVACSSGRTTDHEKQDTKPLVECASYVRELRACSAAVGAPAPAADTLAATIATSDEAARLQMESACAHDRIRLRASCK